MKISLVLPTNRSSYAAISRIVQWSSLDPDRFELVVRDNSESKNKREIIDAIKSPALKAIVAPKCDGFENSRAALEQATGDFVFIVADDDWLSLRGLEQAHAAARSVLADMSVSCVFGDYFVETSSNSGVYRYPSLNGSSVADRVRNLLIDNTPNYLFYAAVRRNIVLLAYEMLAGLPYRFSFHDQLVSLLYVALGSAKQIDRVLYGYDLGEWETREKTLAKDRAFYVASGLPAEYDRLHHLFCGLEGALLLQSDMVTSRVSTDTTAAAHVWFQAMFTKFVQHNRETGYERNAANEATLALRNKLLTQKEIDRHELLLDVCEALEVADTEGAQRYFKFWSTL